MEPTVLDIDALVYFSHKNYNLIKKEHEKLISFFKENPELLKQNIQHVLNDEPTEEDFDNACKFNESLVINSYDKIYKQVKQHYPNNEYSFILYYMIDNSLFLQQKQRNLKVGDWDSECNNFVTGSNLTIQQAKLNNTEFIYKYFSTNN